MQNKMKHIATAAALCVVANICDLPAIRDILNHFGVPANHVVYGMAALGYPDPDTVIQPKERIGKVAYIE